MTDNNMGALIGVLGPLWSLFSCSTAEGISGKRRSGATPICRRSRRRDSTHSAHKMSPAEAGLEGALYHEDVPHDGAPRLIAVFVA